MTLNMAGRILYCLKVLCCLQSDKFESLFFKCNTCLQKTTTCIGLQAEQILSVNIQIFNVFNFEHGFCNSLSFIVFPEATASNYKKYLKHFLLNCTSICISSKNMSQIFKILIQTGGRFCSTTKLLF